MNNRRGGVYIGRSKSLIQFVARIVSTVIAFTFVFAMIDGNNLGDVLPILVLIISISELVVLFCSSNVKNTGLAIIFFIYTLMCHNGFVIAYLFDKSYINFRSSASMAYVHNVYYPTAIMISNIVMYVFVLVAEIFTNKDIELDAIQQENQNAADVINQEDGNPIADIIGIIVLLLGTAFLGYTIISNGLFMGLYKDILNVTSQIPLLQHSVILTSLSIALLLSAGTKKGIRVGLIIFAIDMVLHFSIGNRGEVLYAAVICFALYSLRFKTIGWKQVLFSGLALIIIIPLVRIVRNGEFNIYNFNLLGSFLDVLAEEGFQISPFTYIVQYVNNGHSHVWGMTYVNDFVDFIMRRFGSASLWMNTQQYVIKSIMPYDGMGFSMIAETYYNFTIIGSCIWYAILARFMTRLELRISSDQLSVNKKMFLSMLMVELINLSRNDASTLPVYLAYMIILLLVFNIATSLSADRTMMKRRSLE